MNIEGTPDRMTDDMEYRSAKQIAEHIYGLNLSEQNNDFLADNIYFVRLVSKALKSLADEKQVKLFSDKQKEGYLQTFANRTDDCPISTVGIAELEQ